MRNIYDYPPVQRKYVAVRRYIMTIGGLEVFNLLLKRLGLTRKEFIMEYGESLIGNPAPVELNRLIREIYLEINKEDIL